MKLMQPDILIIEDDDSLREPLADLLPMEGLSVHTAACGEDGMAYLQSADTLPDMIVCDIRMPGMDGYAVLEAVRGNVRTAHIPFMFLTAHGEETGRRQGMQLGAEDYLVKPVEPSELVRAIRTQLGKQTQFNKRINNEALKAQAALVERLPEDLLPPLTGILGFSELLAENAENMSAQQVREAAGDIQQSGQRLLRSIQRCLELQMLAGAKPGSQEASNYLQLGAPATEVCIHNHAHSLAAKHGQGEHLDVLLEPATFACNTDVVVRMVDELLTNTFSYTPENTPVRIRLKTNQPAPPSALAKKHSGSWASLSIADSGPGLPTAIAKSLPTNISEEGCLITAAQSVCSSGQLGLALVSRMAQLMGSQLNISTTRPGEANPGTTCTLLLPMQ